MVGYPGMIGVFVGLEDDQQACAVAADTSNAITTINLFFIIVISYFLGLWLP